MRLHFRRGCGGLGFYSVWGENTSLFWNVSSKLESFHPYISVDLRLPLQVNRIWGTILLISLTLVSTQGW